MAFGNECASTKYRFLFSNRPAQCEHIQDPDAWLICSGVGCRCLSDWRAKYVANRSGLQCAPHIAVCASAVFQLSSICSTHAVTPAYEELTSRTSFRSPNFANVPNQWFTTIRRFTLCTLSAMPRCTAAGSFVPQCSMRTPEFRENCMQRKRGFLVGA